MLERIPQDKEAIRKALVAQIAQFEQTKQITICPPCREAWTYYALLSGTTKGDDTSLILKRTKGDPAPLIAAHRAKLAEKDEVRLEANRLGREAYRAILQQGGKASEAQVASKEAFRAYYKAQGSNRPKGDTKEITNCSLFNGGRAAQKLILATQGESV